MKLLFSLSKPLPVQTAIRLTVNGQQLPWDGSDSTFSWEMDETDVPLSANLALIPSKGIFRELIDNIRRIPNPLFQGLAWLAVPLCGILAVPLSVLRLILLVYGMDTTKTPLWLIDSCPYQGTWTFSIDPTETCTIAIGTPAYRSVTKLFAPPRCAINGKQIEGEVTFDADRMNRIFKRAMMAILLGLVTLCLILCGFFAVLLVSALHDANWIGVVFSLFMIGIFLLLPLVYYFIENNRRKRILQNHGT